MKTNIIDLVKLDIAEQRRLQISIPKTVDTWIAKNANEITELSRGGLSIAQITDTVILLAQ